jgi:hypothetical protein
MSEIKRLFFDLEVSPNVHLSWRAGNKVFLSHDSIVKERAIICVCYSWNDEEEIHHITWNNGNDKELVVKLSRIMNEADEIVAHYGDKFDIKWLKGRNLIHKLPPLPEYNSVDTYKIASKHFYLNSYKLDYLGEILFSERKIDVPYSLWKRITLDNEPSAMDEMVTYCKQDVRLLRRVYRELVKYDTPKTHIGVHNGLDRWTCPHCGSDNVYLSKTRVTPKGMKHRQMQCKDCARYYSIVNSLYKNYLEAKECKS